MLIQLQYVRAIAALMVVYFHSILQLYKVFPTPSLGGVLIGETGVDLFFVLSGFVMWLTTASRDIGPIEFYKRRIERIVPLYWLFTIFAAAIAFAIPSILRSTQFDIPHLLASLLFIPWTNPADPAGAMIAPVIVPGWTLNYEMYFYLLFGVLLVVPAQRRLASLTLLLAGIFLLAHAVPGDSVFSRFYGNSVIFEFLAGVVLARLYMAGKLLPLKVAAPIAITAFAVLLFLDYSKLDLPRVISSGIPATLIIYGLLSLDFSRLREWKFLHLLGDASYSLYITHVYVLAGSRVIFNALPFEWLKTEFFFLVFCITASTIFAVLVHLWFEKPVDNYFKRKRVRARTPTGALTGQETT